MSVSAWVSARVAGPGQGGGRGADFSGGCSRFVLDAASAAKPRARAAGRHSNAGNRDRPGASQPRLGRDRHRRQPDVARRQRRSCTAPARRWPTGCWRCSRGSRRSSRRFAPDTAAVEQTFVNRDGAGTLKLGQARGVAMLVPAQAGLPVGEYAPNPVKKTVVGVGHADKRQIDHMVRLQLPGRRDRRAGCRRRARHRALPCPFRPRRRPARSGAAEGQRMIGRIAGRLEYKASDHVLIDVRGVGYVVYVVRPDPGGAARAGRGGGALHRSPGARGPAAAVRLHLAGRKRNGTGC